MQELRPVGPGELRGLQSPGGCRDEQETSSLGHPQTPLKGTVGQCCARQRAPILCTSRQGPGSPSPRCFGMSPSIPAPSRPQEQGTPGSEGPPAPCWRWWHCLLPADPRTGRCWDQDIPRMGSVPAPGGPQPSSAAGAALWGLVPFCCLFRSVPGSQEIS